jgi:hypothetical protein
MSRSARVLLTTIVAWVLSGALAFGQSTVNPGVPAVNSQLTSAPIRGNFTAAFNDINGLLGMHASASLSACSIQTQTIGADCLIVNSPTAYLWYKFSGPTNGYVLIGTINPSTSPPTFNSGLSPAPAGDLIANCSNSTAIPVACTWTAFANQAISATNGTFPYRVGGIWGIASTGTSGHVVPFLDSAAITFTNVINSGVAGSSIGGYCMANAASGNICLAPTTGALGASVATFPANSGIVAELNLGQTWSAAQTFQSGITVQSLFTATGLVTNADLANPATTVNGQVCTLGGTCTITASATTITVGSTLVSGGPGILFNSVSGGILTAATTSAQIAGILSDETGTGALVFGTSPILSTPALGVATATSVAIGGATIGSNSLAVTGSTLLNNALTYGGVTLANSVTGTGSMVLATAPSVSSLTVATAFTATGLVTSADLASAVFASSANVIAGTSTSTLIPPSAIYPAEGTITFGSTVTLDFSTFINAGITLTGNITTMNVANVKAGQAGSIVFAQDSTGGRTTVFNSIFKFAGGATPTLSTTAGASDVLFFSCNTTTFCPASLALNVH